MKRSMSDEAPDKESKILRDAGEELDEEEILDQVAEERGEEFVEENEELILADAKRLNLI